MRTALLKSVQLYDPDPRGIYDLFLYSGQVAAVGRGLISNLPGVTILDGNSLTAFPSLMDRHVHLIGDGGECDFHSRVPELSPAGFTTAGVATAVGLLGTDSATRSPKALLTRTRALNEEELTAYCLTGAYDIPPPTVTDSLKDDVTYLSEVPGVKVALSDRRGDHPTLEQFTHMACQMRLATLTTGKPGVVHIHMGSGKRGLGLVYDLLEATNLPIWHFRPIHISRWQSETATFTRKSGMMDFIANADPEKCALPVLCTIEEALLERITVSSNAGGSMSRWSEDHCTMLDMRAGKMDNLLLTIRCLVREHRVPSERIVRLLTQSVADGLRLSRKDRLTVGADADVLLVDRDWNTHMIPADGGIMVSDGQVVKRPYISQESKWTVFVTDYPFKANSMGRKWRFTLTDPTLECNQGVFRLCISRDGQGWAERISEPCADQINIQTMATMPMGYKRPDYLVRIGRLNTDEVTIDMLEDAIEQQAPYILDYF